MSSPASQDTEPTAPPRKKRFTQRASRARSGYCSRELRVKEEEESGSLKLVCVLNDGIEEHMIWLIALKNIFATVFPNMPKPYIVRLLFDRAHYSLLLMRRNQLIGGLTFRPFPNQTFVHIAFCAIKPSMRLKGYGTRLMNHLKHHARDVHGTTHLLTHAPRDAVGYFTKQGFREEIGLEKHVWEGYVEDGRNLMECEIHPKIPYTDLPYMIRRQKQAVYEKIIELSLSNDAVCPGIESGDVDLCGVMRRVVKSMKEHEEAWPFLEAVDAREVPDYYDFIKEPMDLETMWKRVESEEYYVTLDMFVKDATRMFLNARIYNATDTVYYKCSKSLEAFFHAQLQSALQSTTAKTKRQ